MSNENKVDGHNTKISILVNKLNKASSIIEKAVVIPIPKTMTLSKHGYNSWTSVKATESYILMLTLNNTINECIDELDATLYNNVLYVFIKNKIDLQCIIDKYQRTVYTNEALGSETLGQDKNLVFSRNRHICTNFDCDGGAVSVVTKEYKNGMATIQWGIDYGTGFEFLFDLKADIHTTEHISKIFTKILKSTSVSEPFELIALKYNNTTVAVRIKLGEERYDMSLDKANEVGLPVNSIERTIPLDLNGDILSTKAEILTGDVVLDITDDNIRCILIARKVRGR